MKLSSHLRRFSVCTHRTDTTPTNQIVVRRYLSEVVVRCMIKIKSGKFACKLTLFSFWTIVCRNPSTNTARTCYEFRRPIFMLLVAFHIHESGSIDSPQHSSCSCCWCCWRLSFCWVKCLIAYNSPTVPPRPKFSHYRILIGNLISRVEPNHPRVCPMTRRGPNYVRCLRRDYYCLRISLSTTEKHAVHLCTSC